MRRVAYFSINAISSAASQSRDNAHRSLWYPIVPRILPFALLVLFTLSASAADQRQEGCETSAKPAIKAVASAPAAKEPSRRSAWGIPASMECGGHGTPKAVGQRRSACLSLYGWLEAKRMAAALREVNEKISLPWTRRLQLSCRHGNEPVTRGLRASWYDSLVQREQWTG